MAASCQEATDAKKAEPVKAVAKSKKEKAMKTEVMKSRYGHKVGSMGAAIDDMVWEGSSLPTMVDSIIKDFGKDETQATAKIKVHMGWLKKKKGVEIVKEGDVFKSTVESI
jgi:hypothetical protein